MRRKSDKVKVLEGNFRQDRAGVMVEAEASVTECPAWLDEVGKQVWARVAAVTGKVDLSLDAEILAVFCDAYSHLIACSQVLRREGYAVISDGGLSKINPTTNVLRELQKTLLDSGKQLGLTVDSRSKAGILFKQEEPDEFEEFLQTGKACHGKGVKQ